MNTQMERSIGQQLSGLASSGALFPLFTPIVAVAQGFGERKR